MTTTPQAALLMSAQNPLLKRCYTMSESHLSGYRVVIGFERLEDAQDAHEYIAKLQATQEPVQVFPPRIMELLEQVASDEPLHTVSAQGMHHAEVRAFLIKYYGADQDPQMLDPLHTVTTRDRFGLVMVKGEPYAIVDIGLRMLSPRELYRAQGFPDTYIIDRGADGRPLTKTAQVRMCGNSVCPPLAKAIVAANYNERQAMERAA